LQSSIRRHHAYPTPAPPRAFGAAPHFSTERAAMQQCGVRAIKELNPNFVRRV
jgi:hypothetical protein